MTDVADTEQLSRLIQSIPSKNAAQLNEVVVKAIEAIVDDDDEN